MHRYNRYHNRRYIPIIIVILAAIRNGSIRFINNEGYRYTNGE